MLEITVKISRDKLNYFRSLARDNPKEIEAILVGSIAGGVITVDSVEYTKSYADQTTNSVSWKQEEYDRVENMAKSRGLQVVGDVHSHPNWDSVPSVDDCATLTTDGHSVLGIVSTYGRKTRVRFWTLNSCLCCKIIYL